MIRIVRKATLDALYADRTALAETREELAIAQAATGSANDAAIRAENTAEELLKDLGQAHADRIQAERDARQARTDRAADKTETDRQLAELREDLAKLRAAAADLETGDTVRAALAHNILRDLYADAWREGLLPNRPWDLLAVVLGFDTPETQAANTVTA
ncbi:hypothetical protein ABZ770_42440 [Streptomyces sp. NPDC006654]|uniref:hypothetical protein n=1 Tax=Streptomyces sp. NPDC006654 TaxID=3156897 RepID=UPI0033F6E5EE